MERGLSGAARVIDGKALAKGLRAEIAAGVAELKARTGVTPALAVILVGDNPASISYVTVKERACAEAGIVSREVRLDAACGEGELLRAIAEFNEDPAIHGILVQLPLPRSFDTHRVIDAISPKRTWTALRPSTLAG